VFARLAEALKRFSHFLDGLHFDATEAQYGQAIVVLQSRPSLLVGLELQGQLPDLSAAEDLEVQLGSGLLSQDRL